MARSFLSLSIDHRTLPNLPNPTCPVSGVHSNISSSLLYHWKRQYGRGKFNNEPMEEAALRDRVEKLERLVGKLTLENEFLKRGLQNSLAQVERNGRSSHAGDGSWRTSGGGAG